MSTSYVTNKSQERHDTHRDTTLFLKSLPSTKVGIEGTDGIVSTCHL